MVTRIASALAANGTTERLTARSRRWSVDDVYRRYMALIRLGAAATAAVSFGLWAVVLVRDVGLNPFNGWTIALGIAAAFPALLAPARPVAVFGSITMIVLAMLPALFGGLGLLYLLPIVLLFVGLLRTTAPVEVP